MKDKVVLGARLLLGLIFTVFGLNGLMHFTMGKGFIPMPPPSPEMAQVMGGLFAAKYLMPTVKIIEVASGLMLLSNKMVTLALVMLAPIVYNILGLHVFVDMAGLPMAAALTVLMGIVAWDKKDKICQLLCD